MWAVLAWWRARWKSVGRNRIARSGQDSIGRAAADRETGADDAGNSEGCGRSHELVATCPEAWAVTWGKSVEEAGHCRVGLWLGRKSLGRGS